MSQISLQSGPKISLAVVANMFWDHFFVATSSTLQTSSRIDCFRTHGFPRFSPMWSLSLHEIWNVEDLQKQTIRITFTGPSLHWLGGGGGRIVKMGILASYKHLSRRARIVLGLVGVSIGLVGPYIVPLLPVVAKEEEKLPLNEENLREASPSWPDISLFSPRKKCNERVEEQLVLVG